MKKYIINTILCAFLFTSCVENPNVTEEVYLGNPNATSSWVTGLKRQLAITTNTVNINVAITSDNYFNNYTQYSKVFDALQISYIDVDVNTLQADVQALREMATYGIETILPSDESATAEDEAYLYFCLGYANVLGGELFTGLPASNLGTVITSEEMFQLALTNLESAYALETSSAKQAAYKLLQARVYYDLGDVTNAINLATDALKTPQLVYQVEFDGQNGISNTMQTATFDALPNRLAPLPRLDFLDPKYYSVGTPETNQKPVTLVKAEEAYLILAEAYLSQNKVTQAKQALTDLLDLVATRPVVEIDDSNETRNGGNRTDYPLTKVKIKFDANDEFKDGYVLNRQEEPIKAYTISGTLVKAVDISNKETVDELLYLVYRLRQEIFMSEGRRVTDLGIKYPISQIEQENNPNVTANFTKSQLPEFISGSGKLDNFVIDESGNVIIDVDLNIVLVANKTSPFVIPFF
tara:strand:+ start:14901 stop:16304 length:1404 start_codon:yes stop_codon:yes gene_type:complete